MVPCASPHPNQYPPERPPDVPILWVTRVENHAFVMEVSENTDAIAVQPSDSLAQDLARFLGASDGEDDGGAATGGGRVGRFDVDPRFGELPRDSGERAWLVAQAHDEDGFLAVAIPGAAQSALGFDRVVDDQADLAAPAGGAGGQADDVDAGVGQRAGKLSEDTGLGLEADGKLRGSGHRCASSSTVRLDPYTTRSARWRLTRLRASGPLARTCAQR